MMKIDWKTGATLSQKSHVRKGKCMIGRMMDNSAQPFLDLLAFAP